MSAAAPQADGSPKRRQVLDAAERLFMAQGYGAVSMEVVARTAGVSKATLYAHFESKDRLFAVIVGERALPCVLDDAAYPADVVDIAATLTAIGSRILRFVLGERPLRLYRIAVAESWRFPELGQAFFESGPRRTHMLMVAWLLRQQEAGWVRVPDPDIAAHQFAALLRGGIFLRASLAVAPAPSEAEVADTVAAAVATWLAAFGTRSPQTLVRQGEHPVAAHQHEV